MANTRKLKALSSKVILPNGNITTIDALSAKDKLEIHSQMCKNISKNIGLYYSSHPNELTNFINIMSQT